MHFQIRNKACVRGGEEGGAVGGALSGSWSEKPSDAGSSALLRVLLSVLELCDHFGLWGIAHSEHLPGPAARFRAAEVIFVLKWWWISYPVSPLHSPNGGSCLQRRIQNWWTPCFEHLVGFQLAVIADSTAPTGKSRISNRWYLCLLSSTVLWAFVCPFIVW